MRLCTFEVRTPVGRLRRLGAVVSEGIVDLNFAFAVSLADQGEGRPQRAADVLLPANMREFLETGPRAMDRAREVLESPLPPRGLNHETLLYRPEDVRLLAPIPDPPSLRDFYAFEDHVKRGFEKRGEPVPPEWYEIPVYYKSGHANILGPDQDVRWPAFTEKFDYELELAIVVGRPGRNLKVGEARAVIAGYTVMNDFSARDIQRKEMKVRLGPAKGKDWATALGPVLVTADELPDPYNLRMTARINGELWSEGSSSSLYWDFEQMLEFLTRDDTVLPGDVIGSGTVGTGCGLELDRWVKPGDTMELEIEGIGVLRNRVVK
ncbi:MAG: fumarylacetoacetate hydrolase family protein [Bryobacteraceae bacterium]|nr:fumarylacetoacetate hydrolase family protein [Bryobacteraceae bacterium]